MSPYPATEPGVPVTAKLSKAFYDKFGHDIVDELVDWFNRVDATYRGELRELNELNFARFDARLEQRTTQLEAKIEQRVAQLDAKLEQRATQLDARIEQVGAKIDQCVASLETTIETCATQAQLERRTDELRAAFRAELQTGLARLEGGLLARIGKAEGRLARLAVTWTLTLWIATLGTLVALVKL